MPGASMNDFSETRRPEFAKVFAEIDLERQMNHGLTRMDTDVKRLAEKPTFTRRMKDEVFSTL
jgi:hypothetical protein